MVKKKETMNTSILKQTISYLPEVGILSLSGILFISHLPVINYPILVIMLLILITMMWRLKSLAIISAFLIGFGSFYMMLATGSEYRDVVEAGGNGTKLLTSGLLIFGFTLVMAIFLPSKYLKKTRD